MQNWWSKIANIASTEQFNDLAIEAFRVQYQYNAVYKNYCDTLKIEVAAIDNVNKIPFLPIEFFKTHTVVSGIFEPAIIFTSSGTSGLQTSSHIVKDLQLYEQCFTLAFEKFYGNITDYCILALLPSYLEREGSSLVHMAQKLIHKSKHPNSGFYLNDYNKLYQTLTHLNANNQKTILLGVTYALLDMAEQYPLPLSNTIIMETGGMKGRRKELIRDELHAILCSRFNVSQIHSEYGMTELLSQGYSKGNGIFETPPWMQVLIRDTYDPFTLLPNGRSGGINVIDLANIYSCCFIETKDIGTSFSNSTFTILGRFDNSDIRGCNLMVV